ncbi:MAG: hypothetical protein V3V78_02370 [Candidatus Woesearchaeota archaeon]
MSTKMKRATITVDHIANELFPQQDAKIRGYLDILEELQRRLQDKGDDPRYGRVIFAVDGQDKYVGLLESNIHLAGVFPRVSAVRYEYGQDNIVLKRGLDVNIGDTLVVVDNENMANMWEKELSQLDYPIRRI